MVSYKLYRCTKCGNEEKLQTNHYGECYPFCKGTCHQIIEDNQGGFRTRVQTPHECTEVAPNEES